MNFERFRFHPLSVLPVESLLSDFADVNFGVEVSGKRFVMVAGVTVHDVKILYLAEVVFGRVGGVDAGYAGVEAAAEYGRQSGLFKTFLVSPLP